MRCSPRFFNRKFCSRPNWRRSSICQSSSDMFAGLCRRDSFGFLACFSFLPLGRRRRGRAGGGERGGGAGGGGRGVEVVLCVVFCRHCIAHVSAARNRI